MAISCPFKGEFLPLRLSDNSVINVPHPLLPTCANRSLYQAFSNVNLETITTILILNISTFLEHNIDWKLCLMIYLT